MAMRHAGPAVLTARRSPAQAGHRGRRPGLIQEDQLRRIEIELTEELGAATLHDAMAILLQCMRELY